MHDQSTVLISSLLEGTGYGVKVGYFRPGFDTEVDSKLDSYDIVCLWLMISDVLHTVQSFVEGVLIYILVVLRMWIEMKIASVLKSVL
jgi:hypothetical protein